MHVEAADSDEEEVRGGQGEEVVRRRERVMRVRRRW